jgi:hypothetical protein
MPSQSAVAEEAAGDGRTQEQDLQERLRADIARYRRREQEQGEGEEEELEGLGALASKASSAFEKVLIADFFVVLGFLGW